MKKVNLISVLFFVVTVMTTAQAQDKNQTQVPSKEVSNATTSASVASQEKAKHPTFGYVIQHDGLRYNVNFGDGKGENLYVDPVSNVRYHDPMLLLNRLAEDGWIFMHAVKTDTYFIYFIRKD